MPSLYEWRVRRVINRHRREHGLEPVRFDRQANLAALAWAHYLTAHDAFQHQDMQRIIDITGARAAGEMLGRGDVTPRAFGRLWLHSPPHRRVMLNPVYRGVGIAAVPTEHGRLVVVNFIRR
jgi:uncharacterized protein YkwD